MMMSVPPLMVMQSKVEYHHGEKYGGVRVENRDEGESED